MTEKVTMATLAKLAKVDISTVSRALNNSPLVKADTKALILKLAEERGYQVNISARNLRRQMTETLGIIMPIHQGSEQTIADPFFIEMLTAVSQAATQRGYDLLLTVPTGDYHDSERRLLLTGRVDGVIVIGQAGRENQLEKIYHKLKKVIVWGGQYQDPNYIVIGSDNIKGGRLATSHLLALGRKKLLFIGNTQLPEVALRYQGMLEACSAAGHPQKDILLLEENFGSKNIVHALKTMIQNGQTFDGVFAASDLLAIEAQHALISENITIPHDVSIIGYDNIAQSANAIIPLTTIDQNIRIGGELMVDYLLRIIKGETVFSTFTPTQLVIRESCGGR